MVKGSLKKLPKGNQMVEKDRGIWIRVSTGEVIDRFTILEIKRRNAKKGEALANVIREWESLKPVVESIYSAIPDREALTVLHQTLLGINETLWVIEDSIRESESEGDFGQIFIDLARSVYYTNDDRASVKKKINVLTGSFFVEEKFYQKYS